MEKIERIYFSFIFRNNFLNLLTRKYDRDKILSIDYFEI